MFAVARIHVHEDRPGAQVQDRLGRCGERVGRDDDLVVPLDAEALEREMESGGRAVDGDRVRDADVRRERVLERRSPRARSSASPKSRTSMTAVALGRRRGSGRWNGIGSVVRMAHRTRPPRPAGAAPGGLERGPGRLVVARSATDRHERVELGEDIDAGRWRRASRARRTLGWRGRLDRLGVVEERLVQLLAGAQADVLDRDRVRVSPGQARQVAREVHDADRLAHVEDEQVARLAEQRRLQDEPRRPPGWS